MGNIRKVNRHAYPIPSEIDPVSDFCAKVYIPNGDDYRRAFLGAYTFFGSWVAWERDREHNAVLASARWREAMDKTFETWGIGCGDDCGSSWCDDMTEEEFKTYLVEVLEQMSVTQTVTVGCGCGCCDGSATTSTNIDDMPPVDYDVPGIVPPEPVTIVLDGDKCNRANYLMVQYRTACLQMAENMADGFSGFSAWFDGIIGWLFPANSFSYDVYLRLKSWVSIGDFTDFDDFMAAYDANFNSFVCAIFSASSAASAKTDVRALLESWVWPQVSPYARLGFKELFEALPFDMLFDRDVSADLPPGFIGRECCGSVPVNDDLPSIPIAEEWEIIPVPVDYYLEPVVSYSVANVAMAGTVVTMSKIFAGTNFGLSLPIDVDRLKDDTGHTVDRLIGVIHEVVDISVITPDKRTYFKDVAGSTDFQWTNTSMRWLVANNAIPADATLLTGDGRITSFVEALIPLSPAPATRLYIDGLNGLNAAYDLQVKARMYIVVRLS